MRVRGFGQHACHMEVGQLEALGRMCGMLAHSLTMLFMYVKALESRTASIDKYMYTDVDMLHAYGGHTPTPSAKMLYQDQLPAGPMAHRFYGMSEWRHLSSR